MKHEPTAKKPSPRQPGPPRSSGSARYIQITERLSNLNGGMAAVITGLMLISLWGNWRVMAAVGGTYVVVIGFNIWVNLVALPRFGQRADLARLALNIAVGIFTGHLGGWLMPFWLWLPFNALAFDHLNPRIARWSLIGMCVAQDGTALIDGAPWLNPLCFTLLALFCWEVSRRRFSVIRDMLAESDGQHGELRRANALLRDSHDSLREETNTRLRIETELRHSQKLESVGRLAAGVAHEINTPVQFVSDSVQFLQDASADLLTVIEKLQAVRHAVIQGRPSNEALAAAAAAEDAADLPYLIEHFPRAFERSLEGLRHVATIVRSMKEFAYPDAKEMTTVDLNRAIESTLIIASNEYKYVARLETDLEALPLIWCHAGDVNQVVLNLVVNAAHAIADVVKDTDDKGRITVASRRDGDAVVISIADTGTGIPDDIRERIFDPFFTTKEVGRGTGQGLSLARAIVVERHKGDLSFETTPGKGTTFFLRLPIDCRTRLTSLAAAA